MSSKKNGLTIAFDGPDGVGKSTQVALTAAWLESLGHTAHITRSSGGTPIGEALRKVSLSDNPRSPLTDMYITLAMGQALAEDLAVRVQDGQTCLIDRSPLTHLAYNTFASQMTDQQRGFEAAELMFKAWKIDILLYLEADQTVLDARRTARTDKAVDYFEKQGADFNERVRQGYTAGLELLKEKPKLVGKVVKIDATPSVEAIQSTIQATISRDIMPK